MFSPWRAILMALLLLVTAGPVADLMAQTPAVEAARPSFRDTRRLEPGPPAAPAPAEVTPKALPSATPFAAQPPAADKAPGDKAGSDKAAFEKAATDKVAPEKSAVPVKAVAVAPKPAWLKQLAPGACGVPAITAKALPAGRMQVLLASTCRAGEMVSWRYGGAEYQAKLDGAGRLDLTVDGFAGTSTLVEIVLADSTRVELPLEAENVGGVTKVALIWRGPADLDLHAFAHAAAPGKAGHVWSGAASSATDASRAAGQGPRGAGFLSAPAATGPGDQVEVYTFVHAAREGPGHIAFAVARKAIEPQTPEPKTPEPKTDADKPAEQKSDVDKPEDTKADTPVATVPTCNPAALAEVAFRIVVAVPGQPPVTTKGIVAAAECGARPNAATGFDTALLPALRLGSR